MNSFGVSLPGRRLVYFRDVMWELVGRDIRLRYKRSVMGIAWTLLNPLAELLVLLFIFGTVLPLDIPNYPSFLFTGILAYGWFQSSLLFATGAIVNNRELIKRPGFPTATLPLVTVASNLIHFLLALPILMIFLVLDGTRFTSAILALPPLVALQFTLTLGLAYMVATLHVTFRDTQYLLKVLLQLLFYLTPVFYDVSSVPERYRSFYHLNPLAFLIDAYRAVLIRGEMPDPLSLLGLSVLAAGLLLLGLTIFLRASYRFVEEL